MKKEKRKSVILPAYNAEHPAEDSMKAPWFQEFLPPGLLPGEAVGQRKNIELFKAFSRIEKELMAGFEPKVKDAFANYYVEALADEEIIRCLPHKPSPVKWEDLTAQQKKDVVFIYKDGRSKGYVESTIRKHIRKHFDSQ